ncbi:hypothetical protein [Carboxylicivirga sp. RSCT41]|uniref:hypothetical protein n=1 Tax=Carboxylicivirga agarovorans TaxID=3417570 RepID=UPI003D334C4E
MYRFLVCLFTLIPHLCFSQAQSKVDSALLDNMMIAFGDKIKNWNPEDEPWTFISFELDEIGLKISYGQQVIHPFLAEYNRKILFETQSAKTDTMTMTLNWGGRTHIEIYHDSDKNQLIMEDTFGQYFFDIRSMEYAERSEDFVELEDKRYLGCINGKDDPLRFESTESVKVATADTLQGMQVLYVAEVMPEFPGGENEFGNYLASGINYIPEDHPQTQATVTFVIDTVGKAVNVEIENPLYRDKLTAFEQSIVDLINSMPDWKPGANNGTKVPVRYRIPIHINPQ